MSEDAAFYGEFELLKWLRRSGCGWSPLLVGCNIIRSPRSSAKCLSTMKWFTQQLGIRWKYLLSEGAQWPSTFYGFLDNDEDFLAFPISTVKWALAKGCTWGTWRCQDLAPARFLEKRRDLAELMFQWAHSCAIDCPCTCTAAAVQPVPNA
eukprot:10802-Heterococcus_DN1.PRE.1